MLKNSAKVAELHFSAAPLMFAVATGWLEIVTLFLSYGAAVNFKSASATTVYDEPPNVRDESKRETIRRLLDAAADGQRPPKP